MWRLPALVSSASASSLTAHSSRRLPRQIPIRTIQALSRALVSSVSGSPSMGRSSRRLKQRSPNRLSRRIQEGAVGLGSVVDLNLFSRSRSMVRLSISTPTKKLSLLYKKASRSERSKKERKETQRGLSGLVGQRQDRNLQRSRLLGLSSSGAICASFKGRSTGFTGEHWLRLSLR